MPITKYFPVPELQPRLPNSITTKADKNKAKKAIILIKSYADTLRRLIDNHKTSKNLRKLHQTHEDNVDNWAEQVAATFNKMESLLDDVDEDSKKLTQILEDEPEKWNGAIQDMAFGMVMTGLHDEEKEMERLRNVAIFEIHELESVINDRRHVEGLHFWQSLTELPEEEQIIEHEKYFAKLLS